MATRQIAETQLSDSYPDEAFYFVTNFVKHPTDLLIYSLPQHYSQSRWPDWVKARNLRALAVEENAAQ